MIAVVGTAFLAAVVEIALMVRDFPDGPYELFQTFLAAFFVSALVVAAGGLTIALPVTGILAWNGMERIWHYPVIGFLAGMLLAGMIIGLPLIWMTGTLAPGFYLVLLPFTLIGALPGCVFGILWWHFHRRHMQDV